MRFGANFNLSPDGKRLVMQRITDQGFTSIWLVDLARGVPSPLRPPEARSASSPVWSPDGREVAFVSGGIGGAARSRVLSKAAAGGPERVLFDPPVGYVLAGPSMLTDWSRDGRYLLLQTQLTGGNQIDAFSLTDNKVIPIAKGPFNLVKARFSPDTKWVAYTSSETGFEEVWVARFPPNGERSQVSSNGGVQPRWRADGRELFYLRRDGTVMAVEVHTGDTFDIGVARPLFKTDLISSGAGLDQYTVAPHGDKFLIAAARPENNANDNLTVIMNWTAALKK
jgi:eukaryotic-like serine/threonine-protein kinase